MGVGGGGGGGGGGWPMVSCLSGHILYRMLALITLLICTSR